MWRAKKIKDRKKENREMSGRDVRRCRKKIK